MAGKYGWAYIHDLDNWIRFGGLYPPIHLHADMRRTVPLGATQVHEGGVLMVRARDQHRSGGHVKGLVRDTGPSSVPPHWEPPPELELPGHDIATGGDSAGPRAPTNA